MATLLPPVEARPEAGKDAPEATVAPAGTNPLAGLPTLMSAAELAAWLGVSPETVRRRIRSGRQPAVEVLGIKRIATASAIEQLRDRVVARLPARYRPTPSPHNERKTDAASVPSTIPNKM